MASFSEGMASLLRPEGERTNGDRTNGDRTNVDPTKADRTNGEQPANVSADRSEFDKAVLFQMRALEAFQAPPVEEAEPANSIDAMLQQRYQDGFIDGQKMAANDAERKLLQESNRLGKTLGQRIESLCASFDREFRQQEQAIAESLLDLALEIASKVLADEIRLDRERALPIVRECIGLLPRPARNTQLKVNPADLELLRDRLADELEQHGLELVADNTIEAGGCVFSNEQFELNSTLAVRWRETLATLGQIDRPMK